MASEREIDEALAAALRAVVRHGEPPEAPHPGDATFASYLAGDLDGRARDEFEAHVARCARCAEDLGAAAVVEASADAAGAAASEARADDRPDRMARPPTRRAARLSGAIRARAPHRVARRLAIAAALVVAVSAALVAGGNVALDRAAPTAAARLAAALGRDVGIADISLAFTPAPALRVDDLRVADDPSFSSADLLRIGRADLAVEIASLWRGRVYGSVRLERPTLRLVRGPFGEWNVEALRGDGTADAASGAAARPVAPGPAAPPDPRVRLVTASVHAGTLAVSDRSGGDDRELVIRDVDLDYDSPRASEPARVSLEGRIDGRAVVLRGEIGPFEGTAPPRYRFAEVAFSDVDLAAVPGAPAAVTGKIGFTGHLAGTGRTLAAVVATVNGAGALDLCCGSFAQRNLERDLVASLEDAIAGPPDAVASALAADPAVAAALAARATEYRHLGGDVVVDGTRLAFTGLGLETRLFAATADGSLTRDARVDARGRIRVAPELARAVVAAAPAVGAVLEGAPGAAAVELPFVLAGRWPEVELRVDLSAAVRTAARALDPRRLAWSLRRSPLLG